MTRIRLTGLRICQAPGVRWNDSCCNAQYKLLKKPTVQPGPSPSNAPFERHEIVILGVTQTGAPFRPSDWAERLCGLVSQFSRDRRIRYSPYVTPIVADGIKCVVIDMRLKTAKPEAFAFLMGFARENGLMLRIGRAEARQRAADVLEDLLPGVSSAG
jgi:hypothetical protein